MRDRKQVTSVSLNFNEKATTVEFKEEDADLMLPKNKTTRDYMDCSKGRCVGINLKDGTVAIGCLDGTIRVLSKDLVPLAITKDAKK